MVQNALSLMTNVRSTFQMAEALIRGLGAHLKSDQLVRFANEVCYFLIISSFDLPTNFILNSFFNHLDY